MNNGKPLSPLLAEISMNNIEKKLHKDPQNVDIFSSFSGTNGQLDTFLELTITIHPKMKSS